MFIMLPVLWIMVGFLVGAYGTLIGAGGGFLLVPLLLFMERHASASSITAISLVVVFFNAASGTFAYARLKRVDYLSGGLFAMASVPGAVLGALATSHLSRKLFDPAFGVLLIAVAAFLVFRPRARWTYDDGWKRTVTERNGVTHQYRYRAWVGILISIGVGFISSLFGIGGGIIHVPALVNLMNFPVHIATATSHFVLAATALAGTFVHCGDGSLAGHGATVTLLSVGVLIGAQVGARLSNRVQGESILRMLAIALGLVGLRLLLPLR